MINSTYKVLTPAGQFDAIFAEDEDIPIEYSGDELAISFFKDWLFINQVSGEHGRLLDSRNLTPRELYGFCQPQGSEIEVMPPFEDLLAYIQEDALEQTEDHEIVIDDQPQEENTMQNMMANDSTIVNDEVKNMADVALDSISGIEKIKLIKEASSIRANLQTTQSGLEKLKLVKRIKEIRDALGVGDGLDKDGLDADGMWPMTRAEYDKIHSDYKGIFPDGTPHALKLVNGKTSIVPVRITDEQPKEPEPEVKPQATIEDVNKVMPLLKQFIGKAQLSAIGSVIRGEEGQFFIDKMLEVANTISTMPKTYGQDGMGDKAIAYLHYFKGAGDWHITEKDMEDEQLQAFGLANLGQGGELGYISIQELIDAGVELDLYWTPKTIGEIKGNDDADEKTISEPEKHYSELILDALVANHGWSDKTFRTGDGGAIIQASVKKDVGGGSTGGMMNPEGARNVYASFDETGRYLTLELGDNDEFDIDCRDNPPEVAAKEFDDKTTEWAFNSAIDKHTLKVGGGGGKLFVEQEVRSRGEQIKAGFIAELEALKSETDINRFNERLDEIAARIERAGLMESLDKELNDAADVLTLLLSEAEKGS